MGFAEKKSSIIFPAAALSSIEKTLAGCLDLFFCSLSTLLSSPHLPLALALELLLSHLTHVHNPACVSGPDPAGLDDVLQQLLLGLVVLVSPRAGKQAVHAPLFGSRYCYVLPLDLAATPISSI